jgi:hypothetical protein
VSSRMFLVVKVAPRGACIIASQNVGATGSEILSTRTRSCVVAGQVLEFLGPTLPIRIDNSDLSSIAWDVTASADTAPVAAR